VDINSNKIVYRYINNNFADLIEMAEYKLHYFPARGRAELIRLMFVAGGAKFVGITDRLAYMQTLPLISHVIYSPTARDKKK
jgi:hypothetical protein